MRDYASILDLVIYQNLESIDAMLLQWDCEFEDRKQLLKQTYNFQYPILKRSKTIQQMQQMHDKRLKGKK